MAGRVGAGMRLLQLTVTSFNNTGVYHLVGGRSLSHKSASVYSDNPALRATVAGLSKIPWLSITRRINDGKSKGKRLKLMFYSDGSELIESCHYLASLEDASELPQEAQELHSLLQRFEVLLWTRLDEEATAKLRQWAETVGAR
ncbi:MAG: hypothetical protein JSS95_03865 [Acidobacteria bacterium]|nr:hypothetical protein [Acidobacteriota bacterium]